MRSECLLFKPPRLQRSVTAAQADGDRGLREVTEKKVLKWRLAPNSNRYRMVTVMMEVSLAWRQIINVKKRALHSDF